MAKMPDRDRYKLLMEDARDRLARTSKAVLELCNSSEWLAKIQTMGEDIASEQRKKWDDPSLKNRQVPEDTGDLLDATHQVVRRVMLDRDHPPFTRACKMIVDMLRALRDIESAAISFGLPARVEHYYTYYVEASVVPRTCYVFLFYLTYLRLEMPASAPEIMEINELLERFRLLSQLSSFPTGVSDCFVELIGRHRFEEHNGRPFENRYHYDRTIRPGESIQSLISMYPDSDRTRDRRLSALRQANPSIAHVDPRAELLRCNPPITTLRMVPPISSGPSYESRIKRFRQNIADSEIESKRLMQRQFDQLKSVPDEMNLDLENRSFTWRDHSEIRFRRKKEFNLLRILIKYAPRNVAMHKIAEEAWGDSLTRDETILVTASRLRTRLVKENVLDIEITGKDSGYLAIRASDKPQSK